MKIHTQKDIGGNDFLATYICEHCGVVSPREWPNRIAGYHDSNYHNRVIPAWHCETCHLNRAGVAAVEGSPTTGG